MNVVIREASGEQDCVAFAALIGEYVNWLRQRYAEAGWLVTDVLDRTACRLAPAKFSTNSLLKHLLCGLTLGVVYGLPAAEYLETPP